MTLRKVKGVWYVVVSTIHGERKASTGCTIKEDAERVVKESGVDQLAIMHKAGILTQNLANKLIRHHPTNMATVVPQYCAWMKSIRRSEQTIRRVRYSLNKWVDSQKLSSVPPLAITEEHIDRYINQPNRTIKLGVITNARASILGLFKFCEAKGYTSGNPAMLVKVDLSILSHDQKEPSSRSAISEEDLEKLLIEARKEEDRYFWNSAILFGYYAGLRTGDICNLEWRSLDTPGLLIVWTRKSGRRIEIPIDKRLVEDIATMVRTRSPHVWPGAAMAYQEHAFRNRLTETFSKIRNRAGLHGVSFHCLRHSYATNMAKAGIPTPHIASAMGHGHWSTTEGYIHRDRFTPTVLPAATA